MNHEYRRAYRQSVMAGLIVPMYTDETLVYAPSLDASAEPGYALTGKPMAIVGIWQGTEGSNNFRKIRPGQPSGGAFPARTEGQGQAMSWTAYVTATGVNIMLYPMPGDATDYVCRYVAEPPTLVTGTPAAGEATSVNIPLGLDDRIALGMARRALIKEGSGSASLDRLIAQTEQDLEFAAHNRISGEAPRVRSYRKTLNADIPTTVSTDWPGEWLWL